MPAPKMNRHLRSRLVSPSRCLKLRYDTGSLPNGLANGTDTGGRCPPPAGDPATRLLPRRTPPACEWLPDVSPYHPRIPPRRPDGLVTRPALREAQAASPGRAAAGQVSERVGGRR